MPILFVFDWVVVSFNISSNLTWEIFMPYIFTLHRESLKRKYSIYVVVATGAEDIQLYVGKVGDNRDGCNPLISRCGNHFSYNKIHSQIRNKITDHESRD